MSLLKKKLNETYSVTSLLITEITLFLKLKKNQDSEVILHVLDKSCSINNHKLLFFTHYITIYFIYVYTVCWLMYLLCDGITGW